MAQEIELFNLLTRDEVDSIKPLRGCQLNPGNEGLDTSTMAKVDNLTEVLGLFRWIFIELSVDYLVVVRMQMLSIDQSVHCALTSDQLIFILSLFYGR